MAEIDVDVTRLSISLEVPDMYELQVRLPHPVDDDEVSARWIKQEHRLVLDCGLE